MRVGLIDVDGGNRFPNIALMKISAWHKAQGDEVSWYSPSLLTMTMLSMQPRSGKEEADTALKWSTERRCSIRREMSNSHVRYHTYILITPSIQP